MTVSYHCDNITQEFEEGQLQVVKNWIEKRDAQIQQLECDRTDAKKSYEDMKAEYEDMKKKCDELKSEMDAMKGKCDALEKEVETRKDSSQVLEQVKERRKLEREITARLDSLDDDSLDKLSNRQLKETLINTHYDFNDLSQRSDEAIDGMYAMAIKYADTKRFEEKKTTLPSNQKQDADDNYDMIGILQEKANQNRALLFGGNN